MTEKELLESYYEMEMNKVFRTSCNYTMSFPRKGFEDEWRKAKEKAALLEQLMARM